MLSADEFLASDVPTVPVQCSNSNDVFSGGAEGTSIAPYKEPEYEGSIDYRVRQLSYSSLLTLHSCPRKFQLDRLRTTARSAEDLKSTITFAYGHVVGEAIQSAIAGIPEEQIIFQMFLGWHTELFAEDEKLKKSLFSAILALQKFLHLRSCGFLQEYELVYYQDKPACELSFVVTFPDGFRIRGFVDAVLRHKETGKIVVLELKTTGASTVDPATYKHSSQAIGYSVVLDVIFPELSSYEVLYLVYQTKSREFNPIYFSKSFSQRARWIQETLLDIEAIKTYESNELYPMRGENCMSFGRACQYFNSCTLSTSAITKPCTAAEADTTEYQIVLSLEQLIDSQLAKTGHL